MMASDGLLFDWFAHVHEKTKVPVRAALVNGILIAILALLLDVKQLVSLFSPCKITVLFLGNVSSLLFRACCEHCYFAMCC